MRLAGGGRPGAGEAGVRFEWVDGFSIGVRIDEGAVVIAANREGLESLAGHLVTLASEGPGGHFHLDETNSLEEGSCELIVELVE